MRITYISPAQDFPVGGVKVLHKHAEILAENGFEAYVYYPTDQKFSCTWFDNKAAVRIDPTFTAQDDYVIIPEVSAAYYGPLFSSAGIRHAIFVQNGYLISQGLTTAEQFEHIENVYQNATHIFSISEDTSEIIKLSFPQIDKNKIIRLLPSVPDIFHPAPVKRKIIAYMPRKLPDHSMRLLFFARNIVPKDWAIVPIHGKSESEVAEILSEAAIFLSFSDHEGCPLPPLEAAFCGCLVIGYIGQGAKEYFQKPNFWSITPGDYPAFINAIQNGIVFIEHGLLTSENFQKAASKIRTNYNKNAEQARLIDLIKLILPPLMERADSHENS